MSLLGSVVAPLYASKCNVLKSAYLMRAADVVAIVQRDSVYAVGELRSSLGYEVDAKGLTVESRMGRNARALFIAVAPPLATIFISKRTKKGGK